MRYIDDEFAIDLNTAEGETARRFTTREFIAHLLRTALQFNSDFDGMKAASRIAKASKLQTSGPIGVESTDWEKLCEAARRPQPLPGFLPYPVNPSYLCEGFVESILNARTEPPAKKRA